jgi:hypothetical protein
MRFWQSRISSIRIITGPEPQPALPVSGQPLLEIGAISSVIRQVEALRFQRLP